jgi:membrane-associated protease RseP (regulator of RpoE activity)
VFIAEPPQTPWDLRFQVLGFPVRVHPLFWLAGILLGFPLFSGGDRDAGIHLLLWFLAFFSSILIHELGHALMIRRFGRDAHIVLYMMGGLAIEGRPQNASGSPWSFDSYTGYQPRARSPQEQILISAAGPGIQFLLLGILVGLVYAAGGRVIPKFEGVVPILTPMGGRLMESRQLFILLFMLMQINFFWPLMNLLPVLPLDGGQIALQVLMQHDPWGGTARALWLSVITGGAIALIAFFFMQETLTAMLFASLAASSFMTLQQMGGGRRPW